MKQKSLRQLARELGVSPSYISMIISGQRKCPDKLRGVLSMFTNVYKPKLNGAWKAGTLPTELLPPNCIYFSPKIYPCQRGSNMAHGGQYKILQETLESAKSR